MFANQQNNMYQQKLTIAVYVVLGKAIRRRALTHHVTHVQRRRCRIRGNSMLLQSESVVLNGKKLERSNKGSISPSSSGKIGTISNGTGFKGTLSEN